MDNGQGKTRSRFGVGVACGFSLSMFACFVLFVAYSIGYTNGEHEEFMKDLRQRRNQIEKLDEQLEKETI